MKRRFFMLALAMFLCVSMFGCSGTKDGSYEAYLSIDDVGGTRYGAIFCIVDLEYDADQEMPTINRIQLPFGKEVNLNDLTQLNSEGNKLGFSCCDVVAELSLINQNKFADEFSNKRLDNTVVCNHGWIYASKKDEYYHYSGCPKTSEGSIPEDERIYFNSVDEAKLFGYTCCPICKKIYE